MKLSASVTSIILLSSASAFVPCPFLPSKIGLPSISTLIEATIDGEDKEDDSKLSFLLGNSHNHQNRRDLFKSIPSNAAILAAAFGGVSASTLFPSAVVAAAAGENSCKADNSCLGPLMGLVGKWEGDQGYVMISVPFPGSVPKSGGEFEILEFNYREQIEIKIADEAALQRGGSIDQFSGTCWYEKTVWETSTYPNDPSKQGVIHKENGMLFSLNNITANAASPDAQIPDTPNPIGRSASIPHGNNAFMFGTAITSPGPPTIDSSLVSTIPFILPKKFLGSKYMLPYIKPVTNPIAAKPQNALNDALDAGPTIIDTIHFDLDSRNGGGVLNTEFIKKRADTKVFKADMWLETFGKGEYDKQLQYAENASILFHIKFKKPIIWPHIMVNTLTKVKKFKS